MKNLIRSLVFLISFCGISQTTTVTYVPSSAVISNPERGFFKHSSSGSTSYNLLSQSSLTNYRLNSNITLIYRNFRLNNFVDSAISDAFLVNMQADFNAMRNAGLKCIIRFTYSSDDQAPVLDATKSRMISHIQQLKPVLQANGDVISVMEAGFIGAWGEWYYTDQAEFGGYGFNQTTLTSANYGHRKDILSALLTAIPANRMIQIRTPYFKRNIFQQNAITDNQGFSGSEIARIGHHNDCFLADNTDSGTYSNIAIDYPYLAQESKFLPVGGETCALN